MENRNIPMTGELYRHFKNKLYQIVTTAAHSETGECMVVYQALYGDYSVYVRPLGMFMSEVDHEKYPEVTQKYRFEKVTRAAGTENKQEVATSTSQKAADTCEPQQDNAPQQDNVPQYDDKPQAEASSVDAAELLMNFLDADTYAEKLNILRGMKKHINDKMAYDMAVSLDIVLNEEPLEEKIKDLENCLKTHARFECNRFR